MNKTGIQYLDYTWNPVTGCTFGCPECWARDVAQKRLAPAMDKKLSGAAGITDDNRVTAKNLIAYRTFTPTLHPERLEQPAKRKKESIVGVCLMGDLFNPGNWLKGLCFDVVSSALEAGQHKYIFLTKQPEEMSRYFLKNWHPQYNFHLGFSARNQAEFDAGWPHMAKLAVAGWKVWVSLEPMQGEIVMTRGAPFNPLMSSVVLGAQSGKNPVTLDLDWVRSVRDQCLLGGVPFMFKQDNSTGKVVSLPELDGKQHTSLAWRQP